MPSARRSSKGRFGRRTKRCNWQKGSPQRTQRSQRKKISNNFVIFASLWWKLGGIHMFDLPAVQAAIKSQGFDGWLLYDFRGTNVLAQRIVGLAEKKLSRRWFYFVPGTGEPRKLVHAIEPASLDLLPGQQKIVYRRWQELEAGVGKILGNAKRVAMEYSPRNGNPYVSRVDA